MEIDERYVREHIWICLRTYLGLRYCCTGWRNPMPYPAEHRQITEKKIIESARRLFNRHGFDAVSIDDVMADAGLTRGSFYSYFESKGDLYAEAVTHILNEKQLLISDGVSIRTVGLRMNYAKPQWGPRF